MAGILDPGKPYMLNKICEVLPITKYLRILNANQTYSP